MVKTSISSLYLTFFRRECAADIQQPTPPPFSLKISYKIRKIPQKIVKRKLKNLFSLFQFTYIVKKRTVNYLSILKSICNSKARCEAAKYLTLIRIAIKKDVVVPKGKGRFLIIYLPSQDHKSQGPDH